MYEEHFKDKATLLRSAIKGEVDGYTFYNLLAEKSQNVDAKRRLEQLRDDEKRHKETLVELFEKYVGGDLGPLPDRGIDALATVFEAGKLKGLKSEMEYIALAIEAELAAARFYKDGARAVDDPEFGKILMQLSDEEASHYDILMAEKEALAGNYYWFGTDAAPMED